MWTFMMSRSPQAGVRGGPQCKHRVHELTRKRLLCHCRSKEQCHGDNLIQLYRLVYPNAYDRTDTTGPPTSAELNALAEARNERSDSEESELDAETACAPQGWRENHRPLTIGASYTEREFCDGQGLCSMGRWAPEERNYPSTACWQQVQRMFIHTAEAMTTGKLLSGLALGRLTSLPFSQKTADDLRGNLLRVLSESGHEVIRQERCRSTSGFSTAFSLQRVIRRSRCTSSQWRYG